MPKWKYLLTVEGVISDTSSKQSECTDTIHNDTLLQWDPEMKRIVAWGTSMWWVPHGLIREVMVNAGNNIRTRLHRSPPSTKYGFHLDVNISQLFGGVSNATELSLARMISVWESNVFIAKLPLIFLDSNIFTPGIRACRLKLTQYQQRAVEWMWELEKKAGMDVMVKTGIPVPCTNIVYSVKQRMFTNNYRPDSQCVRMSGGILAGYRGTGKSLIVRDLVRTPLVNRPMPTFPLYDMHSSLVIVPDHLFTQWKDVLCTGGMEEVAGVQMVETMEESAEWVPREPAPRVVLVKFSALMSEIYKNIKQCNHMEDMVSRRKGTRCKTLVTSTWDRIIVDEFLNHSGTGVALGYMTTHFTWAIQGGATPRDEIDMIVSLFDVDTASGDIIDTVVFKTLPIVLPPGNDRETTVCLTPSENEKQLRELLQEDFAKWGVYTNYNTDMFTKCSTWGEVMDKTRLMHDSVPAVADADEPPPDLMNDDSWLYPDNFLTFTVNGMDINIPLEADDYDSEGDDLSGEEEVEGEESGEEESEEEEREVVPSMAYFEETVDAIVGGKVHVPTCVVCLETECNTIVRCGHMMCFVCAVRIVQKAEPQCPHCRYKISERDISIVGGVFTSTALSWIRRLIHDSDDKVVFIGSVVSGVSYLKEQVGALSSCIVHQSEISGKVDTNVATCVLLDDDATVPITMSNSRGRSINVIKLQMAF
jgi:hypothetical protein